MSKGQTFKGAVILTTCINSYQGSGQERMMIWNTLQQNPSARSFASEHEVPCCSHRMSWMENYVNEGKHRDY